MKIKIYGGSGRYVETVEILPLPPPCGRRERTHTGRVRSVSGCAANPSPGHVVTGGRYDETFPPPPPGCEWRWLTSLAAGRARKQVTEAGLDPDKFIAPATVHGAYKIVRNQGIVLVLSSTR